MILAMLSEGYSLIVIQDERIPLSRMPEVNAEYFGMIVGVMLLMIIASIVGLYLLNCCRYRQRIRQLKEDKTVYGGWNLRRLRETAMDMELQKAEQIVNDMQEIFYKNLREAEPFYE